MMNIEEEVEDFISKKFKYDIKDVKKINLPQKMSLIEIDKALHLKMKLHLRSKGYIV
jgi:hypothetical protein